MTNLESHNKILMDQVGRLIDKNNALEEWVSELKSVIEMKNEAFDQFKEQNDALMMENVQLMHHNRRLIESIEMGDL